MRKSAASHGVARIAFGNFSCAQNLIGDAKEMTRMEPKDYKNRTYLSAIEAAKYLSISVETLHALAKKGVIKTQISASGQMRFDLKELKKNEAKFKSKPQKNEIDVEEVNVVEINGTTQKIYVKNSMMMDDLADNSVHLMVTSPPYFDTKMYSREPIEKPSRGYSPG